MKTAESEQRPPSPETSAETESQPEKAAETRELSPEQQKDENLVESAKAAEVIFDTTQAEVLMDRITADSEFKSQSEAELQAIVAEGHELLQVEKIESEAIVAEAEDALEEDPFEALGDESPAEDAPAAEPEEDPFEALGDESPAEDAPAAKPAAEDAPAENPANEQAPDNLQQNFCARCGARTKPGSNFCGKCGKQTRLGVARDVQPYAAGSVSQAAAGGKDVMGRMAAMMEGMAEGADPKTRAGLIEGIQRIETAKAELEAEIAEAQAPAAEAPAAEAAPAETPVAEEAPVENPANEQAPDNLQQNFCGRCGARTKPGSNFCGKCGKQTRLGAARDEQRVAELAAENEGDEAEVDAGMEARMAEVAKAAEQPVEAPPVKDVDSGKVRIQGAPIGEAVAARAERDRAEAAAAETAPAETAAAEDSPDIKVDVEALRKLERAAKKEKARRKEDDDDTRSEKSERSPGFSFERMRDALDLADISAGQRIAYLPEKKKGLFKSIKEWLKKLFS